MDRAARDGISDLDAQPLRMDPVGAPAPEIVDPVVAVPTGLAEPDLFEPWKDNARLGVEVDGPGGDEAGIGQQVVAGHWPVGLGAGRTPCVEEHQHIP